MMYIIKAFHTETPKPALSTHCNPLWPVLTSQPPKEIEYCWPVRWTRGMRVGFHTISWKISFTSPFVKGFVKLPDHWSKDFKYFTCHVSKQDQTTLKRTNLPSPGKREHHLQIYLGLGYVTVDPPEGIHIVLLKACNYDGSMDKGPAWLAYSIMTWSEANRRLTQYGGTTKGPISYIYTYTHKQTNNNKTIQLHHVQWVLWWYLAI